MSEPYEVVASPFWLYMAPVGTPFPDVTDVDFKDWHAIGLASGDSITVTQTITMSGGGWDEEIPEVDSWYRWWEQCEPR